MTSPPREPPRRLLVRTPTPDSPFGAQRFVEPGRDRLRDAMREGVGWIDAILATIDPDELPIEQHAADMRAAFG